MLADNQVDTTDKELVLQSQKGNHKAFRQLYQRYQQRIRSTLYELCGKEILDDLLQEVFLRVWQGLPKLRQASQFSTWIYRITWNVAIDRRRQFAKGKTEQFSLADEDSTINSTVANPQDTSDLIQLHYQNLVQQGLQILSLEHRIVLILHDLEDIPQKEVAKILKLPLGTVKSRLFYARTEIKTFLQQQGASL